MTIQTLQLAKHFPQIKDVFGLKIYATDSTDPIKVNHAAAVLAGYLDNNQDGIVDDQKVVTSLLRNNSGIIIHKNENEELKNKRNYSKTIEKYSIYAKALYEEEIRPIGSRFTAGSYEADGSIEEILHMITVKGYSYAYPDTFGFEDSYPGNKESSKLSKAARIARGSIDDDARDSYPEDAWYRRYDKGCLWGCIVNEYIYWGLISYLGGLNQSCMDFDQVCDDHLDAGSKFFDEWELNTPQKIKRRDKALHKILTSGEYVLPSTLPNGQYSPRIIKDVITGSTKKDNLKGSWGDDYLLGGEGRDTIMGSNGNDILDGGPGNDQIKGGKGADGFLFKEPNGFGKQQADKIKDFKPDENDSILVDKNTFNLKKKATLLITKGKKKTNKASTQNADFLYDEGKGLLFFNQNGNEKGWGDGGLFAKLQGAPELGASDFTII